MNSRTPLLIALSASLLLNAGLLAMRLGSSAGDVGGSGTSPSDVAHPGVQGGAPASGTRPVPTQGGSANKSGEVDARDLELKRLCEEVAALRERVSAFEGADPAMAAALSQGTLRRRVDALLKLSGEERDRATATMADLLVNDVSEEDAAEFIALLAEATDPDVLAILDGLAWSYTYQTVRGADQVQTLLKVAADPRSAGVRRRIAVQSLYGSRGDEVRALLDGSAAELIRTLPDEEMLFALNQLERYHQGELPETVKAFSDIYPRLSAGSARREALFTIERDRFAREGIRPLVERWRLAADPSERSDILLAMQNLGQTFVRVVRESDLEGETDRKLFLEVYAGVADRRTRTSLLMATVRGFGICQTSGASSAAFLRQVAFREPDGAGRQRIEDLARRVGAGEVQGEQAFWDLLPEDEE